MNEQASRFLIDNVLYFDRDKQMQLYRWMMDRLIWVLGICVFVLGLLWLIWKRRKSKPIDPYLKQYDRLIQKIELVRLEGMLPGDEEGRKYLRERLAFQQAWLLSTIHRDEESVEQTKFRLAQLRQVIYQIRS